MIEYTWACMDVECQSVQQSSPVVIVFTVHQIV
eukprot:COSAG02_NODE_1898_length_10461_cov_3.844528_3_plen_33_part_00